MAGVGLTVVAVFELRWRDAAEFVEEAAVVEPVDPFEGGEFEVVEAAPGACVADEFGLVESDDRFGESVVVALTGQSGLGWKRPLAWIRRWSVRSSAGGGSAFEVSESFFLVADSVGEGFEAGAEVGDFGGEAGEGVAVVAVAAVVVDDGSELGVAVEGGAADAGVFGDGGERDLFAGLGEVRAGGFDGFEVGGQWASAWAMRVSSRSRRRRWRSASSIHPRVSASSARACVSTRWAASTAIEAVSVRKLGQCSQMLA